jgi:hypothetical protein
LSKVLRTLKEFRLSRVLQLQPSTAVLLVLLIGLSIFILGGGVYDIMERPSHELFFYPGMSDQFLNESLIFMLFLVMGMSGGILAFRSTRYTYRPREAKMVLLIGFALLVVAFLGTEVILSLKGL